jgi:hypothetical protein
MSSILPSSTPSIQQQNRERIPGTHAMDFSNDEFNQAFGNLSEDALQAFDLAQQNW